MATNPIQNTFAKPKKKQLLPEGLYTAKIISASYCFAFGHKVIFQLEITHQGRPTTFPFFCNVSVEQNQLKQPGRASKLAKVWRVLRPNHPLSEINFAALIGLYCTVKVKTSKFDPDKKITPCEDWYSVVVEILNVVECPNELDAPFDDDTPF